LKNIALLTLLMMATLLFLLASPAAAGPKAPAAPVVVLAAAPVAPAAPPEEHPHIHEALEAMRSAKHQLEAAAHDFNGHRVKAIEHLNRAIREAEICEQER
jgi:hypothetical protein